MPLIAFRQSTGERVDITQFSGDVMAQIGRGGLHCPGCGVEVQLVQDYIKTSGTEVRAHFRHSTVNDCEFSGESAEHVMFKRLVHDKLLVELNGIEASVDYEVPIGMDWREKGRIADVLVTYATGWQVAHEIQLSAISLDEFQERTDDYERSGIQVIWYLGLRNSERTEITDWFGERFLGYNRAEINWVTTENRDRLHMGRR